MALTACYIPPFVVAVDDRRKTVGVKLDGKWCQILNEILF